MTVLENPHGLELPESIRQFADWFEQYVKEEGLKDGVQYTMVHFYEIQEQARRFNLTIGDDGVITERKVS